ncbi:MAG: high-potential iron-sulfur protein [Haloarculaceae archaeon]
MSDEADETRRRFLLLTAAGATTGLAGCGGGGGEPTPAPTDSPTPTPAGDSNGTPEPVPDEYVTATAKDGSQRDPDGLSAQPSVQYQSEPNDGNQCSGCRFYIPDRNGDGLGACSIVEGKIDPEGWCVSYAALQTETDSG